MLEMPVHGTEWEQTVSPILQQPEPLRAFLSCDGMQREESGSGGGLDTKMHFVLPVPPNGMKYVVYAVVMCGLHGL